MNNPARRETSSFATTAPDSTWNMPENCLVSFNGFIVRTNSKAPASDWPLYNASFSGMVAGFGRMEKSARAPVFVSPSMFGVQHEHHKQRQNSAGGGQ